jgi:glycosyltransferase involved in cell wall biosynthesis
MLDGEGAAVVENSQSGLVCPSGDHEALATAVLKLSQMTVEERREMGTRGLEVTAKEFDRGRGVTKLEEELRLLVHDGT